MAPFSRSLALPLALLLACDGGGGAGAPGAAGSCRLEGAPIALPYAREFAVAARGEEFVLLVAEASGVSARIVAAGEVRGPEAVALASGPLAAAAQAGDVLVQSFSYSWQLGAPRLARYDGAAWSVEEGEPLADAGFTTRGGTLAAREGEAVAVWVEGVSEARARVAPWGEGAFGPAVDALGDVAELSGYSVHAAYDGAGRLHVATVGAVGGERGLVRAVREASGAWGAAALVGAVPGYLQNTVTTAMAADGAGAVWLAEVHGADYFEDTAGGLTVWRDAGAGAERVGALSDDRPVAEGLALAALGDGRVVATASWGENNLDAAASDDAVALYACAASGGCRRALTLDGRRGVFYEATKVAAAGTRGLAVWAWTNKGAAGAQGLTAQRFDCTPAP